MTSHLGIAAQQLRSFIEKVERLEEDKAGIMEEIKEVLSEAKSSGFDVRIMKQILRIRKMKQEDVMEQEELLDVYRQALGMIPSNETPEKEHEVGPVYEAA